MSAPNPNLLKAQARIAQILHPGVLIKFGQEARSAYITSDELEKSYLDPSTIRETAPVILRGLLETSLVNLARNIGGAKLLTVPNSRNTSSHNELILAGQIRLSIARCHPWTKSPTLADFRRAGSAHNGTMLWPELMEVPDIEAGGILNGYVEHLPAATRLLPPKILRINFPTPDFLGQIASVDLKPYFQEQIKRVKATVEEIEEIHDLAIMEEKKSN